MLASTEDSHEDAVHDGGVDDDMPHSTDTGELTRDEHGCVTLGDGVTRVDDGQPALDGEDIIVTDSISVEKNAALQKESESRDPEEEELEEPRDTDGEQEAELRDSDRQQVTKWRDTDGQQEADSDQHLGCRTRKFYIGAQNKVNPHE